MIALLCSFAFAVGLHAGIPVVGVPGVSDPAFQTPDLGWTARVDPAHGDGWVKVFVGRGEAEATAWYDRALESLTLPTSAASGLGDESHGDGDQLFLFRDGNVAVMVRSASNARAIATRLHGAIVDGPAWPSPPTLRRGDDGRWRVAVPEGGTVHATGGRPVPYQPGVYLEPPTELVVWDRYGRPVVVPTR